MVSELSHANPVFIIAERGRDQAPEFVQPCVQINYPNDFGYTRSVEIKHVTRQTHPHTVVSFFKRGLKPATTFAAFYSSKLLLIFWNRSHSARSRCVMKSTWNVMPR